MPSPLIADFLNHCKNNEGSIPTSAKTFAKYYESTGEDTPKLAEEFLQQAAKASPDERLDLTLGLLAAAVSSRQTDTHVLDHVLPQVIGDAIGCKPNGAGEDNLRIAAAYVGGLASQMPDLETRDKMYTLAVPPRI